MLNCFNRCLLSVLSLSAATLSMASTHPADAYESLTLPQLEQRLSEIDSQIGELARYTPRGGFGRVGYRSAEFNGPDHSTSLRIDLAEATPVDQVVLALIDGVSKPPDPESLGENLARRLTGENGGERE